MSFKVQLTARFLTHLEEIGDFIARSSHQQALRWIEGIESQVLKLEEFPEAYPPAREAETHNLDLRQMLHGKGRNQYRIIFIVKKNSVFVLDVRHGRREILSPGDLDDPLG